VRLKPSFQWPADRTAFFYFLQFVIIVALETVCAVALSYIRFLSPINFVWMIGIPVATAWIANKTLEARLALAVGGIIVGPLMPDVLAHLVGYCLQG
jgi:hypothetical protein